MRFEQRGPAIPDKWAIIEPVPATGSNWVLIKSNGIADPSKNELPLQKPTIIVEGTLEQVQLAMDYEIKNLEAMGYKKVIKEDEKPA
jgi:hypothetical protein